MTPPHSSLQHMVRRRSGRGRKDHAKRMIEHSWEAFSPISNPLEAARRSNLTVGDSPSRTMPDLIAVLLAGGQNCNSFPRRTCQCCRHCPHSSFYFRRLIRLQLKNSCIQMHECLVNVFRHVLMDANPAVGRRR